MTLPESVRSGDREIALYVWPAASPPRAVVQVLHGLAEHAGRYERFAKAMNDAGISVIAHDHRGHGPDAEAQGSLGHFADRGGWDTVIDDVHRVRRVIAEHLEPVPHVLLGHSMGSYIAQSYAMRHPEQVDRMILSGSTFPRRGEVTVARGLAWLLSTLFGAASPSRFLNRASFGKFNDRFQPTRSEFDWLSRDNAEVDRYIDDPLCGAVSSNRLWYDLLGGLLEISEPGAASRVRPEVPILITGGEVDPVGGSGALTRLAAGYHKSGHPHVTVKLYPEGRHEMLNEVNRDEVAGDIVAWIDAQV